MSMLLLIKHSLPEMLPGVPANQWRLSAEGRERCNTLSEALRPYAPDMVVSSIETKAVETGQIVAQKLSKPFRSFDGLHEHERGGVDFTSQEQFRANVQAFFQAPNELVFGRETASQTCRRFSDAIAALLSQYPDKNLAVVTHGTVITLFVAQAAGVEPFAFWKKLGLPAFVVFSIPGLELVNVTENVAKEVGVDDA